MKERGKQEDLFAQAAGRREGQEAPLAARMRPRTLDEMVGQEHLLGPGRILRRAIEADEVPSMILWGPPGCGKTSLARIIAAVTKAHFESISAVTAGVADLRRIVEEAKERRALYGQRTILFIDEIHRFNKAQQDVILPHVESGVIVLIGATTENPSFEVVAPLLSRCHVFVLEPLSPEHLGAVVRRALQDRERGLGSLELEMDDEAMAFLCRAAGGDARVALNALEMAAAICRPGPQGRRRITKEDVAEALQRPAPRYDKAAHLHYDIISAFIKSVRGSDPDAALYWLARMLEAGEDPLFIARRLVILAAEDVGLADPQALPLAVACQQAVHFIGMPEAALPLAETTIYLACAPKSNSALQAYRRAAEDARATHGEPVPLFLRNPVTPLMARLGYGQGYEYDHDHPLHYAGQDHLPERLRGRHYYQAGELGYEAQIKKWLEELRSHNRPQGHNRR